MDDDEIKKLPEGWRWASLGDSSLVTLIMGQSPLGETYNKNGEGLPFFQGKADFGIMHPEPSVWCSAPKRVAEPDDVLMSVRAPVGPTNIAKEKCCIGRGLAAMRCKEGLYYKYLILILRNFEKTISSEGAGSIFGAIGKDELRAIEFPLPPTLDDQIRIASELERKMAEVETMRQAAKRQLEAAKAMSSAILSEIFSCDTFKDFELVRLEDWACSVASGQAVSSVGGTYQEHGIRYIQGKNLTNEGFAIDPVVYIGAETHAAMSRSVVKPKDVLINIVGPPIGKICWYPEGQPEANTNQAIVRVHCPDDLDYRFLTYLLRTREYYNYFFEVKVGVRQWNISRTNCADIRIPRVPLSLQHGLVKKFEEKMVRNLLVHAMEQQLEAIEALPGAILREVFDFEEDN
jgi:type I restriction enzyme S subunit